MERCDFSIFLKPFKDIGNKGIATPGLFWVTSLFYVMLSVPSHALLNKLHAFC